MTFVVALLCWFLLSVPAALILGRILGGTVAGSSARVGVGPHPTAPGRFARS